MERTELLKAKPPGAVLERASTDPGSQIQHENDEVVGGKGGIVAVEHKPPTDLSFDGDGDLALAMTPGRIVVQTDGDGHQEVFIERPHLVIINKTELSIMQHRQMELNKHFGHENMHAHMALILITTLLVTQLLLIVWRKKHMASYQLSGLLGLWFVAPYYAFFASNYRFIVVWAFFAVANMWILKKTLEQPLESYIPKLVYKWYKVCNQICYAVGLIGYLLIILCLLGFFRMFTESVETDAKIFVQGIVLLFYGLYFGVLSRDTVVVLSDRMAVAIGYYNPIGFPEKQLTKDICAICGDSTSDELMKKHNILTTTTQCGHSFHHACLKGWCIVGKKDMCPYCKEKVDLKRFRGNNPWDTSHLLYLNLLDGLRYFLVWQPIILFMVHLFFSWSGYE